MSLSSPNQMVWQYFQALRRLVVGLETTSNEVVMKQDAALSLMLAVTVVEAFLNIFFRVVVGEPEFTQHKQRVLDDLKKRKSLDHKLKKWPRDILGQKLNLKAPTPKAFMALKERRNELMHFTSSHETLTLPGVEIQGMADTSALDNLTLSDAVSALEVAEDMVCELLRIRGIPEEQLPHALHMWTGRVPV